MIEAKCDLGHLFVIPAEREGEQASNCPTCQLLTWNPARPKRQKVDLGANTVIGDSDKWNPWCIGLGELDPVKKAARIKDGTIRKNPKTGNWEGYAENHQEFRRLLKESGGATQWEGTINPEKQGWDGAYRQRK
jgi:hypothetical protein